MRTRGNDAVAGEMSADEQAALDADRAAVVVDAAVVDAGTQTDDAPAVDAATEGTEGTDGVAAADQNRTVPLGALHEERERRKSVETALAEEKRARQTLEERTNLILQRITPQQQRQPATDAPQLPTIEQDPVAHILGRINQQGAILGEIVQAVAGQGRQTEAQAGASALAMRAGALEREFAAANPDYEKAVGHLMTARRAELEAVGWTDPGEIQAMMANEAQGLAHRALQQGRNPAEVVYALAKLRGYSTAAAPAGGATDDGAAAAAANGEQLRTIERGQQQSRTTAVRGAGPAPMTVARLAEMSDAEFAKAMETPEGIALMGS